MTILDWVNSINFTGVTPERDRAMLLLRLKDISYREIGARFGVSKQRVEQILRPYLKNKPVFDDDQTIASYCFKNYRFLTFEHLHKVFGISRATYNYYRAIYQERANRTRADFFTDPEIDQQYKDAFSRLSKHSELYRTEHWHEDALALYKPLFDSNPHGRLTVIDVERVKASRGGYRVVLKCQCECGNVITVTPGNLPRTKSCGCLVKEMRKWSGTSSRCCKNLETGKEYLSVTAASEDVGVPVATLYYRCKHNLGWAYTGKNNDKARPVRCVETRQEFSSISDAKRATKLNVYDALTGLSETVGGYHWEFIEKS